MERGWWLGAEDFRQERLTRVEARPGPSRFGEEAQEAEAARAGRLVPEGLQRLGWSEADLAERLQMGSRGHLAWLLRQRGRSRPAAGTDQGLLEI